MIVTLINHNQERRRADLDRVCGYELPPDHILLEKDDGSIRLFRLSSDRQGFEPEFTELPRPIRIKSIDLVQEEIHEPDTDTAY